MFKLSGVEVSLSGKTILKQIDLELSGTPRIAVLGKSGSGKSTLLKLLCFMVRPSAGTVKFRGNTVQPSALPSLRRKITLTDQEPVLWGDTVRDNLTLPFTFASARGETLPDESKLAGRLELVELPPDILDKPVKGLSGGEKQRIAIARALCLEPEVLLLDEPTSALDIVTAQRVFDNITRRFPALGLVFVTHSPGLVARSLKQVLMREGRIHAVTEGLDTLEMEKFLEG